MKKEILKNLCTIYNGSTPSTSNQEYYGGDIIWITPKDLSIQNKKYILKGERNITKEGLKQVKSNLLPRGTVLLSSRAPIGLLSIAKQELVTNQGFKNLVVNEEILNNEFLYYYLKTKIIDLENLGTGTTFKEISKAALENFLVIFPNLSIQKKIADILTAIDNKISLNNQLNDNLPNVYSTFT
ncbi:restriction endonuclease subunit S [Empedobacter sp. GD03739]|uniref:restriction endonuclease subunit S n=1 Tax=Empedobacter sp. GD03739 TaxID=2975376 RepID=UPI00244B9B58|nr:restriction endonuclease subunit S [Empedobacter sp. GD03739]MDH1603415.1 restriction endonuclease subunit S [Empedobacter sp. GD03739]